MIIAIKESNQIINKMRNRRSIRLADSFSGLGSDKFVFPITADTTRRCASLPQRFVISLKNSISDHKYLNKGDNYDLFILVFVYHLKTIIEAIRPFCGNFEPKSERFRTYVRRALGEPLDGIFSTDKISSMT